MPIPDDYHAEHIKLLRSIAGSLEEITSSLADVRDKLYRIELFTKAAVEDESGRLLRKQQQ